MRRVPVAVVVVLLVTGGAAPAVAAAPAQGPAEPTGATVGGHSRPPALNATYTYERLPERPGVVEARLRLPATPSVDRVSLGFVEEVTVVETANLTRSGSRYDWDGDRPATVVYRLPVDWTYTGNRADSWTLFEHAPARVDTEGSVEVRVSERVTTAGEGYVGNATVLLGAHEVYERRAGGGERIRVVVPAGVETRTDPRRSLDALADAARGFTVGGRSEVVSVFLTPEIETEATFLEQPGFALDDETMLIDADSEFDVWTHEYVHTRQRWAESERLRWLTEGSAEYYGWVLSVGQGYDEWTELRGVFTRGRGDDGVLADPDTWRGETEYDKGALVLGVLDREIRAATDGERTLQDVFRRLNRADDPTLSTFVGAVREVGGPETAATARRFVTTNASPDYRPGESDLDRLYGTATTSTSTAPTTATATATEGETTDGPHTDRVPPTLALVALGTVGVVAGALAVVGLRRRGGEG